MRQKAITHRQICTRCVMDTSADGIVFDANGVCNYCTELLEQSGNIIYKNESLRTSEREILINHVRSAGQGKRYDCIIGVSGGMDSAWALYLAVKSGLRPLAVHMDNGWDSELSQSNIENLVQKLGVDLYTHVINWDEYRDLMQALFDADVIDVEILYDNAMLTVNYKQAAAHGLKYILAGTNQATEGMRIPGNWSWCKYDKRNIYALWKKFGAGYKLHTYPAIGSWDYLYYNCVREISWISFLDYYSYNKSAALETLKNEIGYRPYPYKHYESVFTRFYQGYILPEKFSVDKRLMHLSTLIISGQMDRKEVMAVLQKPPYPNQDDLDRDIDYFLKKMGWTQVQLDDYLKRPGIPHFFYPSERSLWYFLIKLTSKFKGLIRLLKASFF